MLPKDSFAGRVALITGGGTGFGQGIACTLAALGAKVGVIGRRLEPLEATVKMIADLGGEALALPGDVRQYERMEASVAALEQRFGSVDLLVNNAAGNFFCPTEDLSINGWNAVVNIVLNGTFYVTKAAFPAMRRAGRGSIINIIATYAWTGNQGTIHSASAKAGVLAMTQTLAVEWAKYHIRANAVAPGPVHTEGTDRNLWLSPEIVEAVTKTVPLGRFGEVQEIANMVAYLLSDYAAYVTGGCFVIDGGAWLNRSMFAMEV